MSVPSPTPFQRWRLSAVLCVLALAVLAVAVVVAGASRRDASAQPAGKMYWVDTGAGRIQRANLDGTGIEDVITGLGSAGDIALDPDGGKMYWTGAGRIQRANLDGSDVEDVVTGLAHPVSIALDVPAGKMYWITWAGGKIQRADLDGANLEDVIALPGEPYGIAVDPGGGKVYWSHWYAIRRANLDGTGEEVVVANIGGFLPWVADIQLDIGAGKMYFTLPGGVDFSGHWGPLYFPGGISRADLDGTHVEEIASPSDPYGIALDVREGKLYYANRRVSGCFTGPPPWPPEVCINEGATQIRRTNLNGSGQEALVTDVVFPAGIALDVSLSPLPPTPTPTPTQTPCPPEACPTTTAALPSAVATPAKTPSGSPAGVVAPDSGTGGGAGGASGPLVWALVAGALGLAGVALLRWGRCARGAE